jgi:RES domain-containing protein
MIPPARECVFPETHRLIPTKYSRPRYGQPGTVLACLTEDEGELQDLAELDGATNARLLGEEGLLSGIGVHELLYGVAYSEIVNASFTHAAPQGGRINNNRRGAWYAGIERETSIAEVAFHKLEQLREVNWQFEEVSTCDDYLADFAAEFHDLRGGSTRLRKYLSAGPIPECYREPQQLASELLERGSNGIVYPSVRRPTGICIVCFRPVLVYHVRLAACLEFSLHADRAFTQDQVREVKSPAHPASSKKR